MANREYPNSRWTVCCDPEDGVNVAMIFNENNNVKMIKEKDTSKIIGSNCGLHECIGRDKWILHDEISKLQVNYVKYSKKLFYYI